MYRPTNWASRLCTLFLTYTRHFIADSHLSSIHSLCPIWRPSSPTGTPLCIVCTSLGNRGRNRTCVCRNQNPMRSPLRHTATLLRTTRNYLFGLHPRTDAHRCRVLQRSIYRSCSSSFGTLLYCEIPVPLYVADSVTELSQFTGKSENATTHLPTSPIAT